MSDEKMSPGLAIIAIFFVIVALVALIGGWYTIGAGERGILLTWGNPSQVAITEGLHFKVPIMQSIVKMDVKTLKYEADCSAASKDLQVVSAKIAVNYHLVAESVPRLYQEIGISYTDRVIQPAVQEVVKAATAQFTAEELITRRTEVKDKIKVLLAERMSPKGILIEDISVTNFDFSSSFNQAIENKVTMEQNALASKNKLEQIKYEAQQKIEEAKGKAEAIRVESEALRNNPQLLELRSIEKWDGKLPVFITAGQTIPMIPLNVTG